MYKKLKGIFAWELIFLSGTNIYYANSKTGDRKVTSKAEYHSPIHFDWLSKAKGDVIIDTPAKCEVILHKDLDRLKQQLLDTASIEAPTQNPNI